MDKLTRVFVIAASSFVIVIGGAWLYDKYAYHQRLQACISKGIEIENAKWSRYRAPDEKRNYWYAYCRKNPYELDLSY